MIKSLEQMAYDAIIVYMKPYEAIGFKGHTLEVATRKAKSNHPNWSNMIDKVSKKMEVTK